MTRSKNAGPRSVAYAMCPLCNRRTAAGDSKVTGLVRQGEHLVWREHDLVTWGGTKTPCRASGIPACRTTTHIECPHQPD